VHTSDQRNPEKEVTCVIMQLLRRELLEKHILPGRIIQKAVGKDSFSISEKMTMGFAHYSRESSSMEPHHHAEEIVYVLGAERVWIRYGPSKDELGHKTALEAGMVLHFPELEWHVFEYDDDGFVDIIFFYGQVENIWPEKTST